MNKLKLFSVALLLSCFAMGCSEPPKIIAPKPTPTEAEPQPTIDWHDYNDGLVFDKAEQTSNLLFLLFYSDNCNACHRYAAISLANLCVVKESKDGFTFTKVNVSTDEGAEAYVLHSEVKPDEDGRIRVAVPTTMIFATIKEIPDFDYKVVDAEGVVAPDDLCRTMKELKVVHKAAIKNILEELENLELENSTQ